MVNGRKNKENCFLYFFIVSMIDLLFMMVIIVLNF